MPLPPFPVDVLGLSNYDLGKYFLEHGGEGALTVAVTAARPVTVQQVIHEAGGDFETAGRLIRGPVQDVFETWKKRQHANAKKPRPDALQALIVEIMTSNPTMTPGELLGELRKLAGGLVVDEITDTEISVFSRHGDGKDVKISSLKDRIYRARKTIASR